MKKTINPSHPLQRNGSTRVGRLVAALAPEHFALDDRTMQDFIVAAHRYAQLLTFFDADERPDGDWTCFWETETLTFLAVLAALPTDEVRKKYDDTDFELGELLEDRRKPAVGTTKIEAENDFVRQLIGHVLEMARSLERHFKSLERIEHPLGGFLKKLIERETRPRKIDDQELVGALAELLAMHKGADDRVAERPELYADFFGSDRWGLPDEVAFLDKVEADPDATRERLRGLFIRFFNTLLVLKSRAEADFDAELRRAERPEIEEYRVMQPHVALFLAFLRLFHHAQNSLNGLVKKQMDFYYEQVLGISRRAAAPDSAFLIFELAKNFEPQRIEKGALLFGGKGKNGRPLFYETIADRVISQAKVAETKAFYLPASPYALASDFGSTVAANRKTVLENPDLLQKSTARTFADDSSLTESEVGFVIASPQLLLQEGARLLEITIDVPAAALFLDENFLDVWLTSRDGWTKKPLVKSTALGSLAAASAFPAAEKLPTEGCFSIQIQTLDPTEFQPKKTIATLKIFLPKDFAPLEPMADPAAMTRLPAVKITLRKDRLSASSSFGAFVSRASGKAFSISVRAEGVSKNLILQTDLGVFDGTQQVFPFGPTAPSGARFLVGFAEAFLKRLDSVVLRPNWVPSSDQTASVVVEILNASDFKNLAPAVVSQPAAGRGARAFGLPFEAFQFFGAQRVLGDLRGLSIFDGIFHTTDLTKLRLVEAETGNLKFSSDPIHIALESVLGERDLDPDYQFEKYDPSVRRGFLRLTLKSDLGHAGFAKDLATKAMVLSKQIDAGTDPKTVALPDPPYTPSFNSIELDYSSLGQPMQNDLDEFIYLHPLGGYEKAETFAEATLFRDFLTAENGVARGHFFIGLENWSASSSSISLLFQPKDGSERRPEQHAPRIDWAWLSSKNSWKKIDLDQIDDSTGGLTKAGVLAFSLPPEASSAGNTLLRSDLFWLRATAIEDEKAESSARALPDLAYLRAQVVAAQLRLETPDDGPEHLADGLPKDSITKLAESRSAIKKIEQPFPTAGGRLPEAAGAEFYLRVSERLRHRDRAVAVWDHEQLLLERFGDVAAAKAIPHDRLGATDGSELAPGRVVVAVVPDLKKRVGTPREQPRFPKGELDEMAAFLAERANFFLQNGAIEVSNAHFEPVAVTARVHFRKGFDAAFYQIQLEKDLKNWLSPWILNEKAAPAFGRTLRRSAIVRFIEERAYVEHLHLDGTDFSIAPPDGETIRAASAHGILCSADRHSITIATATEP